MKILNLPVNNIKPGMVTAEDVYSPSNQLIIPADTKISDRVISRLKFYQVPALKIAVNEALLDTVLSSLNTQPHEDKGTVNVKENDIKVPLNPGSWEITRNTPEFKEFNESLKKNSENLKNHMQSLIGTRGEVKTDELLADVSSTIKFARNGLHVLDMLHCMRDFDDETYMHSMNVAVISNLIGRWSGFNENDLNLLTLSALLHDIGKTAMPQSILKSPTKLTEAQYKIIQTHTIKGYNILREHSLNIHVQMTAMMHHERCDGTGYPMGLHSDRIDKFAKIVMIADVYDAMTSRRPYRGPLCPMEVVSIFEKEGLIRFAPEYLMIFLDHIKDSYENENVVLSDGQKGKIVLIRKNDISKPLIQLESGSYLDLEKENNIYIVQMI